MDLVRSLWKQFLPLLHIVVFRQRGFFGVAQVWEFSQCPPAPFIRTVVGVEGTGAEGCFHGAVHKFLPRLQFLAACGVLSPGMPVGLAGSLEPVEVVRWGCLGGVFTFVDFSACRGPVGGPVTVPCLHGRQESPGCGLDAWLLMWAVPFGRCRILTGGDGQFSDGPENGGPLEAYPVSVFSAGESVSAHDDILWASIAFCACPMYLECHMPLRGLFCGWLLWGR